jgi:hypothetical protein
LRHRNASSIIVDDILIKGAGMSKPNAAVLEAMLDRQTEEISYRLGARLTLAHSAIKSLLYTNGGAIIALLTFLGNGEKFHDPALIKISIYCFVAGLFIGLFTHFGAFHSQDSFISASELRIAILRSDETSDISGLANSVERSVAGGKKFIALAVFSANMSLLLFLAGAICAANGII